MPRAGAEHGAGFVSVKYIPAESGNSQSGGQQQGVAGPTTRRAVAFELRTNDAAWFTPVSTGCQYSSAAAAARNDTALSSLPLRLSRGGSDAACACRRLRPSPRSASAEARAGFPVVERDLQLVAARRQRADVDFAGQAEEIPWADADVTLGDAIAGVHVYDVYGEGMVFEVLVISDCEWQLPDAAGLLTA